MNGRTVMTVLHGLSKSVSSDSEDENFSQNFDRTSRIRKSCLKKSKITPEHGIKVIPRKIIKLYHRIKSEVKLLIYPHDSEQSHSRRVSFNSLVEVLDYE